MTKPSRLTRFRVMVKWSSHMAQLCLYYESNKDYCVVFTTIEVHDSFISCCFRPPHWPKGAVFHTGSARPENSSSLTGYPLLMRWSTRTRTPCVGKGCTTWTSTDGMGLFLVLFPFFLNLSGLKWTLLPSKWWFKLVRHTGYVDCSYQMSPYYGEAPVFV